MANGDKTLAQQALAACRGAFLAVGLFSFCVNLLMLTMPLYMLQVFDRVLSSRSQETLIMLSIVAAGAFLTLAILDAVRARVLLRVGTRLDTVLGGEALAASIASALRGSGHSIQALRDLAQLRGFLGGTSRSAWTLWPLPLSALAMDAASASPPRTVSSRVPTRSRTRGRTASRMARVRKAPPATIDSMIRVSSLRLDSTRSKTCSM